MISYSVLKTIFYQVLFTLDQLKLNVLILTC